MAKKSGGSGWGQKKGKKKAGETYEEWRKRQQSPAKQRRDDYELPM